MSARCTSDRAPGRDMEVRTPVSGLKGPRLNQLDYTPVDPIRYRQAWDTVWFVAHSQNAVSLIKV